MAAALTRLRSAVGRLGPSGARAFSEAAAEAEAAGPRRDSRAFAAAAVAAGSGLGIWLLPSNPQPLADSGQVADAASAVAGGGKGAFSAFFGGVGGAAEEREREQEQEQERRFLFGGEHGAPLVRHVALCSLAHTLCVILARGTGIDEM